MMFDYIIDDTEKSLAPFFSRKMVSITLNSVWILLLIFLLLWPSKELFSFVMEHEIPMSFQVVFTAALLMISYVSLRCGRGEIFSGTFSAKIAREKAVTFEEERDFISFGLVGFLFHTLFLLSILLPLLIVSAAISEAPPKFFFQALSIIFMSSLLCRMFGFLTLLILRRWSLVGYLSSRVFYIFFMFATSAFAAHLNPILLFHTLFRGAEVASFTIIVSLAIVLLTLVNRTLVERNRRKKKAA